MHRSLLRILRTAPLALLSLAITPLAWLALTLTDLVWLLLGKRWREDRRQPSTKAASIVIPNWNGRDLLEKYLPSVVEAASAHPDNEVIVVDNGSTDGSA